MSTFVIKYNCFNLNPTLMKKLNSTTESSLDKLSQLDQFELKAAVQRVKLATFALVVAGGAYYFTDGQTEVLSTEKMFAYGATGALILTPALLGIMDINDILKKREQKL